MADQSIRVTNLPDSGSVERVAFDLFTQTRQFLPDGKKGVERISQLLQLYSQCRDAARGGSYDLSKLT